MQFDAEASTWTRGLFGCSSLDHPVSPPYVHVLWYPTAKVFVGRPQRAAERAAVPAISYPAMASIADLFALCTRYGGYLFEQPDDVDSVAEQAELGDGEGPTRCLSDTRPSRSSFRQCVPVFLEQEHIPCAARWAVAPAARRLNGLAPV